MDEGLTERQNGWFPFDVVLKSGFFVYLFGWIQRTALYRCFYLRFVLISFSLLCLPFYSMALGLHRCETVEEYVVGAGVFLPPAGYEGRGTFSIDAGERRLFDVPGLKMDHARLSGRFGRAVLSMYGSAISSPVGRELVVGTEAGFAGNQRFALISAFRCYMATINEMESDYLLTLSVKMCAQLSSAIRIGYVFENFAVGGIALPGVDSSIFFSLSIFGGFIMNGYAAVNRYGSFHSGISVIVQPAGVLRLSAGYEDRSGILKSSLSLFVGPIGIGVGAGCHPILGVTQAISISWEV